LGTFVSLLYQNFPFIGPKGLTGFSGFPKPIKVYNQKLSLDPIYDKKCGLTATKPQVPSGNYSLLEIINKKT
jgi:hypothetical protein